MKVIDCIERYGTPKARLARDIGIHRVYLYAYLEPSKYEDVTLTDETLQKIADFEGRALSTVRNDWRSRKAA